MPKMKTRKSAAKRFKLTASGKLVRRQAGQKHLLTPKTSKRIRALKGKKSVHDSDLFRVTEQLPYKGYLR
jgi:large subunit ribosomal protein L35